MTSSLPASIESYLKEADFSSTEILILHHLLDGRPVSLRELSLQVNKSTGTLDGGMKKLQRRKIVKKENINGTPKYVIPTHDHVLDWVRRSVSKRRDVLRRKEKDFESFITSIKRTGSRPGIDYFDGKAGMTKAYEQLLLHAINDGKEMLQYLPADCCHENNPLIVFNVEYFQARRVRGVQLRTIAPEAESTRRYQSRDPFEYRKTVLIDEDEFPHDRERIIAGDVMACINRSGHQAYFIHAPDLVRSERQIFEYMWARAQERNGSTTDAKKPQSFLDQWFSALRSVLDHTKQKRIVGQRPEDKSMHCRVKEIRSHH